MFARLIVLSAVGSTTPNVVSNESAVEPSNMKLPVVVVLPVIAGVAIVGLVKVLFVNVAVLSVPTRVVVSAGNVIVMLPEKSECAGAVNAA